MIECADPCCGGSGIVDCEANPDVSCVEDADVCTALEYGCSNGSEYSGVVPPGRPPACSTDGGAADVVTYTVPDGFSSLVGGGGAESPDGASDGAESGVAPDGASGGVESGVSPDGASGGAESGVSPDGADDSGASD